MTERETYLAIQSYMLGFGQRPQLPPSIRWESLMQLAHAQSTTAMIAQGALQLAEEGAINEQMQVWMEQYALAVMAKHRQKNMMLAQVVETLRNHGIDPVLLKGYGLALTYPNPDWREFGDIDLYVGETKYHEACEILRELYPNHFWESDEEGGKHLILVLDDRTDDVIEVHHLSAEWHDENELVFYRKLENEGLTQSTEQITLPTIHINGEEKRIAVRVPSMEFNSLYVFIHLWHHYVGSCTGWKQLNDWAIALHRSKGAIDDAKMRDTLEQLHILDAWQVMGYLVVKYLGLPKEEMPCYTERVAERAEEVMNEIMALGLGGRAAVSMRQKKTENRWLHKLYAMLAVCQDWKRMHRLFPEIANKTWKDKMRNALKKNIKREV